MEEVGKEYVFGDDWVTGFRNLLQWLLLLLFS